ncbi:MAG: caspase family protein [Xanthobacteraceae bacterium]
MLTETATKKTFITAATAAVLGLSLLLISALSAHAERRVALVVGNSAYQHADYLPNPIKDAKAMAEKFKQAGFEVVSAEYDTGNLQFKRAIRHFEDIATGADIAVVFYAGHGIEINGVNYLIPVDAKLRSDRDVEDETIALGRLTVSVEGAKRLRLVILDACRDNPFIRMKRERVARTRQIRPGLGAAGGTGTDTLVAYASKHGTTAEDGSAANSPFTAALLKHLFTPGLDVRLAFGRIRDAVLESTGGRQEPYVYGSLGKETVSVVPAPVKVAVNREELAAVKADYRLVERIGSKRAWEVFLKQYPSGFYADLARQQIRKLLREAPKNLAALAPPKPPAPPRPSSEEQRAWDRIKDSSDPTKLKRFIKRFPASVLANTARLRLDALERAADERDAQARAEQERKAAERARLKAEREAERAEEERRERVAAEAARQKAEREAALSREKAEREAELTAEARREAACKREEGRLAALQSSGTRSLGDLRRLSEELTCDRVRPAVIAALDQAAKELELVRTAQRELVRIGCLDGRVDGILGSNTRGAIERYMSEQGKADADASITDDLVAALKQEPGLVCPLPCSSGEVIEGGRCVAVQRPEPAEQVANTPELVRSAQRELVRIGCLDGRVDGILGNNTRGAIERYLTEHGKADGGLDITDELIAALKRESGRVCPLTCSSGEVVQGGRCVVVDKGDADKAAPARAKARRDEKRREQAVERARERKERAAERARERKERAAARRARDRNKREAARARAREERASRRRARRNDARASSRRRSKRTASPSRSRVRQSASRRSGGVGAIGVGF